MQCLVIGASGYVGSRLVPQLLDAGFEARCLARDPARLDVAPFRGQVEVVEGDVVSGAGLTAAVDGVDVLYYLVHSLSRRDFGHADQAAAEFVAQAAADAGVARVVYLGGLRPGSDDVPSRHLASRAEVGDVFLRGAVPAAVLQAGVVTGQVIESIGGRHGWHTVPLAWELRGWLDQLLGGVGAHRGRRDPQHLRAGEVLDWWRGRGVAPSTTSG